MPADPTHPETEIRRAFEGAGIEHATSTTIRCYGPEILSFLRGRLRIQSDAEEAYSMFAEDLWNSMSSFAWRCSMRTWCYALARNAALRYATSRGRFLALHQVSDELHLHAHTFDAPRTHYGDSPSQVAPDLEHWLGERLDAKEQVLLRLRVEKGLSFRDLAVAINADLALDPVAITRESARLRKVFQRLKDELRTAAKRDGLLLQPD
ncbi:MAG TPA: sigma-70 family RNA polymerase sigma factor [Polyangiales bacterium]|nr:sigma-70 family RNA polymerase sigma factor [Polyangiales bacterium]